MAATRRQPIGVDNYYKWAWERESRRNMSLLRASLLAALSSFFLGMALGRATKKRK